MRGNPDHRKDLMHRLWQYVLCTRHQQANMRLGEMCTKASPAACPSCSCCTHATPTPWPRPAAWLYCMPSCDVHLQSSAKASAWHRVHWSHLWQCLATQSSRCLIRHTRQVRCATAAPHGCVCIVCYEYLGAFLCRCVSHGSRQAPCTRRPQAHRSEIPTA